ncbi:hypothetical protein BAQ48_13670 [Bacillus luti]|uniref:hypothetical protein n=1 Tax=Bacillus luti TaxID=2026191 RepID=UPI0009175B1E|nr:hypothetical protein [Bacillus luti]OJE50561.1 hypothetical protein BAQ48_13670 [Bacillus luti]
MEIAALATFMLQWYSYNLVLHNAGVLIITSVCNIIISIKKENIFYEKSRKNKIGLLNSNKIKQDPLN